MADAKTDKSDDKPKKEVKAVRHEVVIALPAIKVPKILSPFQGFVDFIREQGVVGLAVGLVLGTQVKMLVDSLVNSFINPILGMIFPGTGSLVERTFSITFNGKVGVFAWGFFVNQLISFIIVLAIIYFIVKGLKLDKLDKKKK